MSFPLCILHTENSNNDYSYNYYVEKYGTHGYYGTWHIAFQNGQAQMDKDGDDCDSSTFGQGLCDPYILMKINGTEVFRSKVHQDKTFPQFFGAYISDRASKNENIVIEMWDDDSPFPDDLMSRWGPFNPEKLSSLTSLSDKRNNKENSINIQTRWRPY